MGIPHHGHHGHDAHHGPWGPSGLDCCPSTAGFIEEERLTFRWHDCFATGLHTRLHRGHGERSLGSQRVSGGFWYLVTVRWESLSLGEIAQMCMSWIDFRIALGHHCNLIAKAPKPQRGGATLAVSQSECKSTEQLGPRVAWSARCSLTFWHVYGIHALL